MTKKIVVERSISKCRDCMFVTNSAQLHDDPFTSQPANNLWYCQKNGGLKLIEDEYSIPNWCPLPEA